MTTDSDAPVPAGSRTGTAGPTLDGWGGWAEGFLPGMLGAGHGSALIAFALPETS